ncbi:Helicase conserved C-terminal domain-containing protein [Cyclonatronum proteinivorum]|uniref:Helicase conserved C-terminal domain-containing protein n=1 Tax=Cyclonatronum proteinivorum TaxID=1457365 RepID=A0A345UL83_9BACT|nr:DEAD/DEAH box helicase [Cyclonatronum proteinivorum]AXJ01235.1 Helicase conserved C-terminal domain-containing protein [Cyclonatronum proteinivorum]
MNALDLHKRVTDEYKQYIKSFINIKDESILKHVKEKFDTNGLLPEPLVQFNPAFDRSENIDALLARGMHKDIPNILGNYRLFRHQEEAIRQGISDNGFIVTSGTGSGKSLTFLATIFNYVLKHKDSLNSIAAVLVYPMNALINSQEEEIMKYEINYLRSFMSKANQEICDPDSKANEDKAMAELLEMARKLSSKTFPIRYSSYTGQSSDTQRQAVEQTKPHILLTNYMMLELILTREKESWMRQAMAADLKFLVFDELHTYRGRQGSDVSMLVRRIKQLKGEEIICIGTSATMATEGGLEEQKMAVAEVGKIIFDRTYKTDQVIGEYLQFYTDPDTAYTPESVRGAFEVPVTAENFRTHPLCMWLEREVAIIEKEPNHFQRGTPQRIDQITIQLAKYTGADHSTASVTLTSLLAVLENLNAEAAARKSRESFLPFKLHQFVSQTSTVFVTLEPPGRRRLSLYTERYLVGEDQEQVYLYPLVFSRHSGHEFLCVRKDFEKHELKPRDPDEVTANVTQSGLKKNHKTGKQKQKLSPELFPDGYLLFDYEGEDPIWSDDQIRELPDTWWSEVNEKPRLEDYHSYRVPRRIYVNKRGKFSDNPTESCPFAAWFVPARLLFDPTSGMVYGSNTKENTKLMKLGNEGRSTATTITAFGVVRELIRQQQPDKIQKLLSFTDNRQDASLQAGHFNDFIVTVRLRSALYHALKNEDKNKLKVRDLADAVFDVLNIKEAEYAREPNDDFPDKENEDAFKSYLLILLLLDLKKGWRYNLPNLEQTGLLTISYDRLDEFCGRDEYFAGNEILANETPESRVEILTNLLHYFRTSNAITHPYFESYRSQTESMMQLKLDENKFWSPEKNWRIPSPTYMRYKNPGKTSRDFPTESIGPQSKFGKYIKQLFVKKGLEKPNTEAYEVCAERICQLLKKANQLTVSEIKGKKDTVSGYRLRTDNIVWRLGDGKTVWSDPVRNPSFKDLKIKPNIFFKELYETDFSTFTKTIRGAEHTGQVDADERIKRENEFRKGKISALFCSPTMELGIDIKELNIVHMRNVPPNPANYAQRSGRAGRSGQTAVVFTYCANRSPHDRNYFSKPEEMVSGKVVPPRIDLINEELLLSHLHAFILMKLSLRELSVSVKDVIDVSRPDTLPVRDEIRETIHQALKSSDKWANEFLTVISGLIPRLKKTSWYSDEYLFQKAGNFWHDFNSAFERWRVLFRHVQQTISRAQKIQKDPTIKSSSPEKRNADLLLKSALRQQELLLNDKRDRFGNESEFYVFRYLAAEGFLPGYNFTRLPVRVYAGYRSQQQGSYISRPRFIALKEFGPGNLIYHNGSKYRIHRMMLADLQLRLQKAVVSKETSYIFVGDKDAESNNDPITRKALDSGETMTVIANLTELSETEALPQERISCEEEERTSTGYQIDNYFSYPQGIEATQQANIKVAGEPLLRAIYCPATQLVQVNHRWRRSQAEDSFLIHEETGVWLRQSDRDDPEKKKYLREVRIFARDTADTLYLQPVKELGLEPDQVITLAYALKRGVETVFQVEESEIGVWILGSPEAPNIMLYEAAEGSLGILSQMISEDAKMKQVYTEAYRILHYDPETRTEDGENLLKASYSDLLSYYNQPYHDSLDRTKVKEPLERLMDSVLERFIQNRSYEEQYQWLLKNIDYTSATEAPLIHYLYKNRYVLPNTAQENLSSFFINADFVFYDPQGKQKAFLFCDGSIHANDRQQKEDEHKRNLMRDSGLDVITWFFNERSGEDITASIEQLISRRKDIFRKL